MQLSNTQPGRELIESKLRSGHGTLEGPESEHGGAAIEIDESIPPALIQHALSQRTTHGIQHALSQSAALGIQQPWKRNGEMRQGLVDGMRWADGQTPSNFLSLAGGRAARLRWSWELWHGSQQQIKTTAEPLCLSRLVESHKVRENHYMRNVTQPSTGPHGQHRFINMQCLAACT